MFTGIVEELGQIDALEMGAESARITVRGPLVCSDAVRGASIAVNGVCLTVVEQPTPDTFVADVMATTLRATSLGSLQVGSTVNLERPVAARGRLGGHIVQGHVDGVGTLIARTPGERYELVQIELPADLARYVVHKGSIGVDGVSLTVAELDDKSFTVSLIPETLANTTLGQRAPGDIVNLEVDVVAKYVERMMAPFATASTAGVTR